MPAGPANLPVGPAPVTSPYGPRPNVGGVNLLPDGREMHHGIDYGAPVGTPIHAVADGTVIVAQETPYGGGLEVVIDHGVDSAGERVFSRYSHQSAIHTSVGARVQRGDVIGAVGQSGNTTGAHLHLEMSHAYDLHDYSKQTVDPNVYLSGQRTLGDDVAKADAPAAPAAPAPPASASEGSYVVKGGDTLGSIASQHGMDWQELHRLNAATVPDPNTIVPGQRLVLKANAAPDAAASTYVVQPGDTLGAIATRHGLSLGTLVAANAAAVPNPNVIFPGLQLHVPR